MFAQNVPAVNRGTCQQAFNRSTSRILDNRRICKSVAECLLCRGSSRSGASTLIKVSAPTFLLLQACSASGVCINCVCIMCMRYVNEFWGEVRVWVGVEVLGGVVCACVGVGMGGWVRVLCVQARSSQLHEQHT